MNKIQFPFLNTTTEDIRNEFVIISNPFIGDNLLAGTLAQNIKKIYKGSKVIMITEAEQNVEFIKLLEGIDDVYFWDRKGEHKGYKGIFKFIKNFPYKNIHTVFPLYNYDRLVIFAHLLKPKYVVTTSERLLSTILMKNKYFLKHKEENVQISNLNLLKGITKEPLNNSQIKFNVPNINTNITKLLVDVLEYTVLCPISSRIEKNVPFEVVEELIKNSITQIVLLGAGEQAKNLSQYLKDKNLNNYIDLLNKTSLLETSYILKNSKSVISVDTGLLHLACALNKTIIELIYEKNYQKRYLPDKNIYNVNILFNEFDSKYILSELNKQFEVKSLETHKKIKLIFDADVISNGTIKNSSRTGIYFTAYSLFKVLIENDNVDLKLYCNLKKLAQLDMFLESEFKDVKFEIISEVPNNFITGIYKYFLRNRTIAKAKKQKLKKFYYDLLTRIMRIFLNIQRIFYHKTFLGKINSCDVFLSCLYAFPNFIKSNNKIEKYLILYDCVPLIIPECNPVSKKGSWYDKLIKSINAKDNYFAISDSTRNDFLKYCPQMTSTKITTTLISYDNSFKQQKNDVIVSIKQKYNIPLNKKYVFSLCTLEPRKNLIRMVKTFIEFITQNNIDDLVFVLGGGSWKVFIGKLEKEIDNLGDLKEKIIKIGYVEDEDLPALYSGAEWFTYTSQYEGFGLPPLEAMSCGCPVITSNNSSLPEVVGDSGIMIDWDNDEQHIKAYEKYYFDNDYRKQMAQKGQERSKHFSWEKCANQMINVILKNYKGEKND